MEALATRRGVATALEFVSYLSALAMDPAVAAITPRGLYGVDQNRSNYLTNYEAMPRPEDELSTIAIGHMEGHGCIARG